MAGRRVAGWLTKWGARAAWGTAFVALYCARTMLIEAAYQFQSCHVAWAVSAYFGIYVLLAGAAVPGAVLLTIAAGFVFGEIAGTILASFASTAGATISFLLSRHVIGGSHSSPRLGSDPRVPLTGRQLLLLRLIPVCPFFAVNLLAGRSKLRLGTYWVVSQIGMLPATYLLVLYGSHISESFGR